MKKGYTVVEPPSVEQLCGKRKCYDLAILVLSWIADEANTRKVAGAAVVEVIRVEYLRAYPALGVHGETPDDIEARLYELSDELMRSASVADLAKYAADSDIDWREYAYLVMA